MNEGTKFTEGPWEVAPSGIEVVTPFGSICELHWKPNAHLIAAAPELYDAVQHLRVCAVCAQGSLEDCDGGRAALAALAKADGGP